MSKLTNVGLKNFCNEFLNQKTIYVYGTFGSTLTSSTITNKAKQYPSQNSAKRVKLFNQALKDNPKIIATDCVGVIKAYLWGGYPNPKYNGSQDVSANGMYAKAKKRGNIDYKKYKHGLPEIVGLAVQMDGHIGVYVGNGYVIESTPNTKFAKQSHGAGGVCKTHVTARNWSHWLEIPFIEYLSNDKDKNDSSTTTAPQNTYTMKTTANLNCRKSGNKSASIVGVFDKGAKVTVLEDKADWFKVTGKDQSGKTITGYCSSKYLAKEVTKVEYVKTTGDLNCRAKADSTAKVEGVFKKGTKLELVQKTNANWNKVKGKCTKGNTITGYCSTKYLTKA